MSRKQQREPCADEAEVISRSCTSKLQFQTEILARMGAKRHIYRSQRGKDPRNKLWVYRCRFCPGWHVTSRQHWSAPVEA